MNLQPKHSFDCANALRGMLLTVATLFTFSGAAKNLVVAAARTNLVILGEAANSGYGEAMAGGDFNGDGLGDLAVAEPRFKENGIETGRVLIYFGHTNGISSTPSAILTGNTVNLHRFGSGLTCSGDVDGDGCSDLLVQGRRTAEENPQGPVSESVLLFSGRNLASNAVPAWRWDLPQVPQGWVIRCHGLGDLDHDGRADFAVSVIKPLDGPDPETFEGVRIIWGNSFPLERPPISEIFPDEPNSSFGNAVVPYPDIDGDGVDELLIASPNSNRYFPRGGGVRLWHLRKQGISQPGDWVAGYPLLPSFRGDAAREQLFGFSLSNMGDADGDGWPEIVIAAPWADDGDLDEGVVSVFKGSSAGLQTETLATYSGDQIYGLFGYSTTGVGDVNRDGFADLLVAAPAQEHGQDHEGVIYLFAGSPNGLKGPVWAGQGDAVRDQLGDRLCALGDVNGDGYSDFAAASPNHTQESGRLGRVNVFYGSERWPHQMEYITFGKPLTRRIAEWWQRRYSGEKAGLGFASVAVMVGVAWYGRRTWRRRTIILIEKKEDETRKRTEKVIARDLHDELGAKLSRISLVVEKVRRDLHDPTKIAHHTTSLTTCAHDLRTAVERLVVKLKTGETDVSALIEIITRDTDALLDESEIRVVSQLPAFLPRMKISERVRHEVLACLHEALANVLEHSCASEVWLRIVVDGTRLHLEIEDNGVGFPVDQMASGNGLKHLRERMVEIGGGFQIRSAPTSGTCVVIEVDCLG